MAPAGGSQAIIRRAQYETDTWEPLIVAFQVFVCKELYSFDVGFPTKVLGHDCIQLCCDL